MRKKYIYKIYSYSDETYLGELNAKSVKSEPKYTEKINGGQGELRITYVTQFDDFDETLIGIMNIVKLFLVDDQNPKGRQLFNGYVSKTEPHVDANGNEGVKLVVLGVSTLLTQVVNTDLYTTEAIDAQLTAIIDAFHTVYPSHIVSYSAGRVASVANGGETTSTDNRTALQAIEESMDASPEGYYWKVDGEGQLVAALKATSAEHYLTVGKDVEKVQMTYDSEQIKNYLTFVDRVSTNIFEDATSQTAYGKREEYVEISEEVDEDYINSFGDKFIAENKDPKRSVRVTVNNNYDIESLKPGDTVKILNYKKTSGILDSNMQIHKVTYGPDKVVLHLEQNLTYKKILEQINRQFNS